MKLSDVSIDRPVFTAMMGAATLVLGGLALMRLGVDLFPDVSFPVATIVTPYPGAGPEEVESQVTRPIEEAVSSINGIDEVRSFSRESLSTVVVMFKMEADVRQGVSDVRDRIGMIRGTLPKEIRDPIISRVDPSAQAIMTFAVASPRGSIETRQYVDDVIRPELERVDGVGSVTIVGGAVREIRVELNRGRVEAVGLTVAQIAQAIGSEGFDVPSGRVTAGAREIGLKAAGRFRTAEDVGEVVLVALPTGTQVRVRDIGTIHDTTKEARTLARANSVDSVTFEIQKRAGTNTVAVADGVERAIAKLVATRVPGDYKISKVIDSSVFIRNNIHELRSSLVIGGLLAILVIFIFMLDWRSTVISAISLPTSVIASFFVMWQLGYTINIMTMMALSLAIGMLIDDSVVVRENIFRHMERGEDPVTAARRGTSEIALAVMATTFTIVAVFGPVAFTGGIVGRMFRQFGITVSAAVIVSLLVSFTLDPMLSARITQKVGPDHHERVRRHLLLGPLARAFDALDIVYRNILMWTLGHRKTVFAAATVIFIGSMSLAGMMGREFFGRSDVGDFSVNIELAAGTSLAETDRVTKQVEAAIRELPEVITIATVIGPAEEVNKATIRVKATPKTQRTRVLAEMMEVIRPRLAAIPGLVYNMREAGLGGAAESTMAAAPIVLCVRGTDYGELARIAQAAFDIVRTTQGVRDGALNYRPGIPEQQLVVDRTRAGDLGVSFAAVAMTLRTALDGEVVAKFREGEHDRDVRLQMRPLDRIEVDELRSLTVPTRRGRAIEVRDVTRVEETATPATIERLNRQRQITITANVVGRSLGDVIADLEARLDKIPRQTGYTFHFAGEAERMKETFENMGLALALAIIFIYLVLASQFESFLHPFTIMFSLPLAVVGAIALLFLADKPFGMPAMIGIVLLMGLVTKNAILLVDFTNQLRARGKGIIEALLEAGPTRLRPILMTSAAMVLGMLPTAIGTGEGSEFRSPMSIAVIGGVVTSTLLTLVVVPVVYVWVDRLTLRGRRERRDRKQKRSQTNGEPG